MTLNEIRDMLMKLHPTAAVFVEAECSYCGFGTQTKETNFRIYITSRLAAPVGDIFKGSSSDLEALVKMALAADSAKDDTTEAKGEPCPATA